MSNREKVCVHGDIDFLTIYLSLGHNALPPSKRVSLSSLIQPLPTVSMLTLDFPSLLQVISQRGYSSR